MYLIYFFHVCRLEMGHEDYIASIVNAHRINYEAKAPEREQRIAHACARYAARNPELIDEIYNSEIYNFTWHFGFQKFHFICFSLYTVEFQALVPGSIELHLLCGDKHGKVDNL